MNNSIIFKHNFWSIAEAQTKVLKINNFISAQQSNWKRQTGIHKRTAIVISIIHMHCTENLLRIKEIFQLKDIILEERHWNAVNFINMFYKEHMVWFAFQYFNFHN